MANRSASAVTLLGASAGQPGEAVRQPVPNVLVGRGGLAAPGVSGDFARDLEERELVSPGGEKRLAPRNSSILLPMIVIRASSAACWARSSSSGPEAFPSIARRRSTS